MTLPAHSSYCSTRPAYIRGYCDAPEEEAAAEETFPTEEETDEEEGEAKAEATCPEASSQAFEEAARFGSNTCHTKAQRRPICR
jgi:hypothetical protein